MVDFFEEMILKRRLSRGCVKRTKAKNRSVIGWGLLQLSGVKESPTAKLSHFLTSVEKVRKFTCETPIELFVETSFFIG